MFRDDCELFDMTHSHITWHSSKVQKQFLCVGTALGNCKIVQQVIKKILYHMLWYIFHSEVCWLLWLQVKSVVMSLLPFRLVILTLCFTAVFLSSNPLCSLVSQDYLELLFSVHTNERSIYGKIDHFLGPLVLSKAACSTALRKIFLLRSFDWGWGAWHHLTAFILLLFP